MQIEIAPKPRPFIIRECGSMKEAEDALNAEMSVAGTQLVSQVYQVVGDQTRYIFVFLRQEERPQLGKSIALPEHLLRKN